MNAISKERTLYVDYLRMLIVILVVMIHLAVTYSAIGSWYYYEPKELDPLSLIAFALFQSFTQGYSMGFMFLLAGFFVPGSFDRKGFGSFVKGRLIRLGIPALIYMLILHPLNSVILADYYQLAPGNMLTEYGHYLTSFEFVGSSGPLWFAVALLIFSVIYAIIRLLIPATAVGREYTPLSNSGVWLLIAVITAGAFLIRLVQPIGTSILNMQLCFFSQYIVLFIIGILAYRNRWFDSINYRWGMKWLKAALIPGVLAWITIIYFGGALTKGLEPFTGGLNWTSFAYAAWESFTAVSMSVGLLALFKEKFNQRTKLSGALSECAFAVYLFHAPIIIFLCYSARDIQILPILKFVIAAAVCIPTCFGISYLLKKIPLLNKVI